MVQRDIDSVVLALDCKDAFQLTKRSKKIVYESPQQTHGKLLKAFFSDQKAASMLLFQDFTVHYIEEGKQKWKREESLSQIVQVEVLDQEYESNDDSETL